MYQEKPPIDELMHYGMPRRSGRYPWGSGENPYQHSGDFLSRVEELRKNNFTFTDENGKTYKGDTAIAKSMGLSTTQFRTQVGLATDERRSLNVDRAKSLKEDGLGASEIGRIMGVNESTVRSWLNSSSEVKMKQATTTADILKTLVKEKGMIDVGDNVNMLLGVSKEKLDQALEILKMDGYEVHKGRMPQVTNPGKLTTMKVLCPPGTEHKEIYDYGKINSVADYVSKDGGDTFQKKYTYPASMDSKRLMIRYAEDGGADKDGLVELRRNVDDLSLGNSRISQVRILVDDKKYIKGMAGYSDDMPDGIDVIFNTNKKRGTPKLDVLKDIKNDPDNPFGSSIKDAELGGQYWYTDKKTGQKKLGLINKRADEGDWAKWKDKVPSQFLSKQPLQLAKRQLKLAIDEKQGEYDEIRSLTNPTIKKKLLNTFANDCDSAAVHLYAAALPRQKYHVIMPITSLKDNECYASRYNNGEKLALIRFPHGGTFEIPIVTVNNRNKEGKNLLGDNIDDAIGINSKVAARLSGADFDGDTVMAIPLSSKVNIKSTPLLKDLDGFDPKMSYGTIKKSDGYYNSDGQKVSIMKNTQNEMGRISNLITDMTLRGATEKELARAVKHSMVVIDAEKHKLDYKKSYKDNGIETLKKKYQEGGASTLISRAKGETSIPKTKGSPKVNIKGKSWYDPNRPEGALVYNTADDLYYPVRKKNKDTGMIEITTTTRGQKVVYDPTDSKQRDRYEPVKRVDPKTGAVSFTNKDGTIQYKVKMRTEKSTRMQDTDDAYTLVSKANTPMERVYADYANKMKALANTARKLSYSTEDIRYNKDAAKKYSKEVASLNEKLKESLLNSPRERRAQAIANSSIKAKMADNPDMSKDEIKKLSDQEIKKARQTVGAERKFIEITDDEWRAIQSGAISKTVLNKILDSTDLDIIREKATPRTTTAISPAKASRIKSMQASGYTVAEIAKALGLSYTTVSNYINN